MIPEAVRELLLNFDDGCIDADGVTQLSAWITQSPSHADAAARFGMNQRAIEHASRLNVLDGLVGIPEESPFDDEDETKQSDINDFWALLSALDVGSSEAKIVELDPSPQTQQARTDLKLSGTSSRDADTSAKKIIVIPRAAVWLAVAAMVALSAVLLFQMGLFDRTQEPGPSNGLADSTTEADRTTPVLATVKNSLGAQWLNEPDTYGDVQNLRLQQYVLLEGMVELELGNGTSVILEGPTTFAMTGSNSMVMQSGRLLADVPPAGYGFTVDTPSARIVDYGTKFAVVADASEKTQVHVIEGEVRAGSRTLEGEILEPVSLKANDAAEIGPQGVPISFIDFNETIVKQQLVRTLDLVDIIAGGDGTGRGKNRALHSITGQLTTDLPGENDWYRASPGKFIPCPDSSYIAGVFSPTRAEQGIDIDPAGNRVVFPDVDGKVYGDIWAGPTIPTPARDISLSGPVSTLVAGEEFVGEAGRLLSLTTNVGFTFDLHTLSQSNQGAKPSRLSMRLANQGGTRKGNPGNTRIDLSIYIDGQLKESLKGILTSDGAVAIDVPIGKEAQYLTIVVTDGGDTGFYDWVLIADPVIEMITPAAGARTH